MAMIKTPLYDALHSNLRPIVKDAIENACNMLNDCIGDADGPWPNPSFETVVEQSIIMAAVILDPDLARVEMVSDPIKAAIREYAMAKVGFKLFM